SIAIVGAMRGDEIQQQYICAQLVNRLTAIERHGGIVKGKSVLVIPSCNPFSMNVSRRFWAMDNTDINRMFPGYDNGETTQRIAAAVFDALKGFEYGIQLASYYVPGDFIPHVRMLKTGYEDVETARLFGMRYVTTYKPRPFDTTLLNYNWQLWNTKAFSVYAGKTTQVDQTAGNENVDAILRMMSRTGILATHFGGSAYESEAIDESTLLHIKAQHAGILLRQVKAGSRVHRGQSLANIIHPYNGQILSDVKSTVEGTVFFAHNRPVVLQNALLFKIHTIDL
ncbi:MAG: succinylglutamate desuccinylase/aspartoacylase family protein, partial [Bacteroidaceae bacterium]|nr:succinylglutamate desuccinylase/aspartoacylase family protein [Bacteroidaceae bacterium]